MKIVINTDYGGFGLSDQAFEAYLKLKGIEFTVEEPEEAGIFRGTLTFYSQAGDYLSYYDIPRNDPELVKVVEELGKDSWGNFSSLKVVEVPGGVEWYIHEYEGIECIHEAHRQWS